MKFKEMNTWSKILYVLGIISVVEGVYSIAYAIVVYMQGESNFLSKYASMLTTNQYNSQLFNAYLISLVLVALLTIVVGLLNIRGAKNNNKILIPFIFSTVNCALYVYNVFSGQISVGVLISLLQFVACLMIFINNRKTA